MIRRPLHPRGLFGYERFSRPHRTRTLTATTRGLDTLDWPGARQLLRLERTVTVRGQTTTTVSYAITSLSPAQATAAL